MEPLYCKTCNYTETGSLPIRLLCLNVPEDLIVIDQQLPPEVVVESLCLEFYLAASEHKWGTNIRLFIFSGRCVKSDSGWWGFSGEIQRARIEDWGTLPDLK